MTYCFTVVYVIKTHHFLYEITREFIIFVVLYSDNKTYMLILDIVLGSKNGFAPE